VRVIHLEPLHPLILSSSFPLSDPGDSPQQSPF
jgi:hypothetical protein